MRVNSLAQPLLAGVLAAAACGTSSPQTASAAVYFEFDDASLVGQPGEMVDVPVYLRFSGSDATNLLAEQGLLSAGVRLDRSGSVPAFPSAATAVVANVADFNDPVFVPTYEGPTATTAGLWAFADLAGSAGVIGQSAGPDQRILLGMITFQFGSLADKTTTFVATDFDPTTDQIVTFAVPGTAYDSFVVPATLTLSTEVPEPSIALVLATFLMGSSARRRR